MKMKEKAPTGLFDFQDYRELVEAVSDVLDLPQDEVHERLFHEAIETGYNTVRAARIFGIAPHVFDERMEEFYQQSHTFVFELLVSHLSPHCQEIDRRIVETVEERFKEPLGVQLLALGDGIGTDSLRFAVAGYQATYFDFAGYSANLAQYRFRRQGVHEKIRVLHQLEEIPKGTFDAVVCREVLEHVPDPPAVIENIWSYLRPDGIAIITESFGRIEPAFPTHLASNKKYQRQAERLFVECGFRLLKTYPQRRPLVFQKTTKADESRFSSLANSPNGYPIRNFVKRVGRRALRLIRV